MDPPKTQSRRETFLLFAGVVGPSLRIVWCRHRLLEVTHAVSRREETEITLAALARGKYTLQNTMFQRFTTTLMTYFQVNVILYRYFSLKVPLRED